MSLLVTEDGTCIICDGDIVISARTREEAERELARLKEMKLRRAA